MGREETILSDVPATAVATDAALVDLGRGLLRQWWLILAAALLGLAAASIALHVLTFRYTATLQLTPTEQAGTGISRNISGLASLAGVSLPKTQVQTFPLLLETLHGRDVAALLARDRAIMHHVFAKDWDARTATWRQPPDGLRGLKSAIKGLLGIPNYPWQPPGAADLQEHLQKRLDIAEDTKRSIATVGYSDADPAFAARILGQLVALADQRLRARALARSTSYIAYIQEKLRTVSIAEHREALVTAMSEQEKQRMMASANQPFAGDPFGSVAVSEKPTSPIPALVLGGGVAAGVLAGFGIAYLRLRRRPAAPAA